jgi:23S rRNA (cytosine1962-C5)-methyltransferase
VLEHATNSRSVDLAWPICFDARGADAQRAFFVVITTERSMNEIVLTSSRRGSRSGGHPWIFEDAIGRVSPNIEQGSCVHVLGADGTTSIGWGLYSMKSKIRVRLIDVPNDFSGTVDRVFLARTLRKALQERKELGLDTAETNGFRLINSEGDGLGGVTLDVYANVCFLQLTTFPMVQRRDEIVAAIGETFTRDMAIYEVAAPSKICDLEGFPEKRGWHGEKQPAEVEFVEDGVRFVIRPEEAQKTGHYADMRIHRQWLARRAAGKTMLDIYCYTGGFGLHAAKAGATEVLCIDSSQSAVATAMENATRNGFDTLRAVVGKADDQMRSLADRGQVFDIVVVDPPKLASHRSQVRRAQRHFESQCVHALRLVKENGILALGSCSEAMGMESLHTVLANASSRLKRRAAVIYTGAQSPDHPYLVSMPQGRYLSFLAARIT